jgi:hypothetical protein
MTDKNTYTFDVKKFNQDFEDYLTKQKKVRLEREQKFLESKEVIKREKLLHELTFYELVANTKNTVFDVIDDIINLKFNKDTLMKNNRLFYIGLILIIFSVILIMISIIIPRKDDCNKSSLIK